MRGPGQVFFNDDSHKSSSQLNRKSPALLLTFSTWTDDRGGVTHLKTLVFLFLLVSSTVHRIVHPKVGLQGGLLDGCHVTGYF